MGEAGGGHYYPDSEDEAEPKLTRHADHDPSLICRPALGYGLCEVLEPWLTVVNPDVFMTFCGECGEHFKKGGKVQRIEGGYGYRCEQCGKRSETAATG